MALLSAAMLLLSRIGQGLEMTGIVLGLALAGVGVAMTATPVTAVAVAELPSSRQGLAGALVSTSRTIGLAVGVAVMGALLGAATGEEMTSRLSFGLKANAGVAAAGALAAIWLLPTTRQRSRRLASLKPARETTD
jgi:MFS family permease